MARDPYGYTGGGAFRSPSSRDPVPEGGWPFGTGVRSYSAATPAERREARRARQAQRQSSRARYREELRAAGEEDRARRRARREARRSRTRVGECAGDLEAESEALRVIAGGVKYAVPAELGAELEPAPPQPSAGMAGAVLLGGIWVLTGLALYRQHRRGGPGH